MPISQLVLPDARLRWLAPLLIVACWAVAVRYACAVHPLIDLSDTFFFIDRAQRLKLSSFDGWVDGLYPVGYPALLRAVAGLTGDYPLAGRTISICAGLIGLLAVFQIGRVLFCFWIAVLAIALLVLSPFFIEFSITAGTDMLAAALMALSASFMAFFLRYEQVKYVVLSGLTLGLAYLIRYTALPIIPAFLAVLTVAGTKGGGLRRAFILCSAFAAAFSVGAFPQLAASFWETSNPLFNTQAKNALFGLRGAGHGWTINWNSLEQPSSLLAVVWDSPQEFFRHLFGNFIYIPRSHVLPYPLDLIAYAFFAFASARLRGKSARINLFLLLTVATYGAAISILWINTRFMIFAGMLLVIYAAYGLFSVTRPGAYRYLVIAATLALVGWLGGIRPMIAGAVSEYDLARMRVSSLLHQSGMKDPKEVLSFSSELYDVAAHENGRFGIPWYERSFDRYRSIGDIADRMKEVHQSFLVFGADAPESVLGLAAFWPLSKEEMKTRFQYISSAGSFEIWKLLD